MQPYAAAPTLTAGGRLSRSVLQEQVEDVSDKDRNKAFAAELEAGYGAELESREREAAGQALGQDAARCKLRRGGLRAVFKALDASAPAGRG